MTCRYLKTGEFFIFFALEVSDNIFGIHRFFSLIDRKVKFAVFLVEPIINGVVGFCHISHQVKKRPCGAMLFPLAALCRVSARRVRPSQSCSFSRFLAQPALLLSSSVLFLKLLFSAV